MGGLIVFTDLDGTLLAHEDYDWTPAAPALEALRRRGAPVVIASSKTRAEIERWRERLGNTDPFVCENGGALYVPRGGPIPPPEGAEPAGDYLRVEYGTPYADLRRALRAIAERLGVVLRGFGDLPRERIEAFTNLRGEDLDLALRREYDEPFVAEGPLAEAVEAALRSEAAARGLRITRGGRFYHLIGANSKARAARDLLAALAREGVRPVSVAIGDGANDLELLQIADHPIVVARPDGTHAPELRAGVPAARFAPGAGPVGFAQAILEHLARPA